jgi:predicted phage terminase large subunit-like protein
MNMQAGESDEWEEATDGFVHPTEAEVPNKHAGEHALEGVPDHKRLAMARLLHIPYSPHQPYLKQARFLLDFKREALYGGAAGGGKSDALLMAALQFVDVPGYAAILFRRSYSDLSQPGALMDRAREWFTKYKPEVRWSEIEHKWTFPSGATVSFAYIDKVNDHLKYQGAEFQYVGFDELTQFKEKQYRYLFSRLRKVDAPGEPLSHVPLRMRAATNPGGPGHHWVYLRFVKPWEEWQRARVQWARTPPHLREELGLVQPGEAPTPHFHPATIDDNPFLSNGDYDESLQELDQVTKAQLRKGDWQIKPDGRMFKRTWFEIVPDAPSDCRWVRWWDLAATEEDPDKDPDYTAGALMGISPQGIVFVKHMIRLRVDPHEVEVAVKQAAMADGQNVPIGMEQEPGSSGKTVVSYYRRIVLAGRDFYGRPSSGSKIERAKPFAGRAGKGDVKLVAGTWIGDFLDECEVFPDGEHDDQIDAASAGYIFLTQGITGLGSTDDGDLGAGLAPGAFGTDDLSGTNAWRGLTNGEGRDGWAA